VGSGTPGGTRTGGPGRLSPVGASLTGRASVRASIAQSRPELECRDEPRDHAATAGPARVRVPARVACRSVPRAVGRSPDPDSTTVRAYLVAVERFRTRPDSCVSPGVRGRSSRRPCSTCSRGAWPPSRHRLHSPTPSTPCYGVHTDLKGTVPPTPGESRRPAGVAVDHSSGPSSTCNRYVPCPARGLYGSPPHRRRNSPPRSNTHSTGTDRSVDRPGAPGPADVPHREIGTLGE